MTIPSIRERIDAKAAEIRSLQDKILIKRAEMEVVRAECRHENRRNYTVMGDPTQDCADCGKSFY